MDFNGMLAEKRAALHELQEDISALERVQRMSANGLLDGHHTNGDLPELRKMLTQKDAMDYIADQNDGIVKVNEVKKLLLQTGFIKGKPKYAYGHLYNILKNDERYEAMGVGTFRKKGFEAAEER